MISGRHCFPGQFADYSTRLARRWLGTCRKRMCECLLTAELMAGAGGAACVGRELRRED